MTLPNILSFDQFRSMHPVCSVYWVRSAQTEHHFCIAFRPRIIWANYEGVWCCHIKIECFFFLHFLDLNEIHFSQVSLYLPELWYSDWIFWICWKSQNRLHLAVFCLRGLCTHCLYMETGRVWNRSPTSVCKAPNLEFLILEAASIDWNLHRCNTFACISLFVICLMSNVNVSSPIVSVNSDVRVARTQSHPDERNEFASVHTEYNFPFYCPRALLKLHFLTLH